MISQEQEDYKKFKQLQKEVLSTQSQQTFKDNLDEYVRMLVGSSPLHSAYFESFIQHKLIHSLMQRLIACGFEQECFKTVFHNLEIMIKSFRLQEQTLYLVTHLHKEGYITQKYNFENETQAQYYILILKSLLRTMLLNDERFANIFLNIRQPHFPIAFTTMRFFNHKQQHVATGSKYILLELTSHKNAQNHYLQNYFLNFPFVSYYAHLSLFVKDCFHASVKSLSASDIEYFTLQLVYLEEMVATKGSEVINMYSNSMFSGFLKPVFKTMLSDKANLGKALRLLGIVCQKIRVQKIRQGIRKFLKKDLDKEFEHFMTRGKDPELSSYSSKFKNKYFFDDYLLYIIDHCKCLYTKQYKHSSSTSMFRKALTTINSYIVSNERWLEGEMQKISQILGVELCLYNPVDHDRPLKTSYLWQLSHQLPLSLANPLYHNILEQGRTNQGVYYYFLNLLYEMNLEPFTNDLRPNLQLLRDCQSVSTLLMAIAIIKKHEFEYDNEEKALLRMAFQNTIERIVSYVLEEGWDNWEKVCAGFSKIDQTVLSQEYQPGIFRSIECDAVFLMILRGLLGMNQHKQHVQEPKKHEQTRQSEIIFAKIMCSLDSEANTNHYLKVEAQYIKFYTEKDQPIGAYCIKDYKLYEDPTCPSIIEFINDTKQNESFTVYFSDGKLAQYFQESFKETRNRIREFELELYNLHFKIF